MSRVADVAGFVRDVIREFTWQKLLLVQVLAVLVQLIVVTVFSNPLAMVEPRLIISEIVAWSILLAALIGDQAVARGMTPLLAYALSLVSMAVIGSLAQFELRSWLQVFKGAGDPSDVEDQIATGVYVACDILSYGALFVLIYLDHRRRLRLMRRVAIAEFERARYQQQAVDSRFAALQAEVDPIEVIRRLEALQQMYARDSTRAEQMLDEFTADMRAKVAQPAEAVGV